MSGVSVIESRFPAEDIADGSIGLVPEVSFFGRLEVDGDTDTLTFTLPASFTVGTSFSVTILGIGGTPVQGPYGLVCVNGEPFSSTTQLFAGFSSSLVAFDVGVTYEIVIGNLDGGLAGGYMVTLAAPDPSAMPVFTSTEAAWQLLQNYASWEAATQGSGAVGWRTMDLSSGELRYDVSALTPEAAVLAVTALQMWNDILGLTLVEVTDGSGADITFDDDLAGHAGQTSLSLSEDGTTILSALVTVPDALLQDLGSGFNSPAYEAYLHEIGHALGLGNAGNYLGVFDPATAFYANDTPQMSVMTAQQAFYDDFWDTGFNTDYVVKLRYLLTPMLADVTAMELAYGRVSTARPGDTTYGYNSNTGNALLDQLVALNDPATESYVGFTLVDGGGTDTLDLSGFGGNQIISLRPDTYSDVLGGWKNMNIARGTWIEFLLSGGGDDKIGGNLLDNRIEGGAGRDTIRGFEGADTLDGQQGIDRLYGGEGDDLLLVDEAGELDHVIGGAGFDRVEITATSDLVLNLARGRYGIAGSPSLTLSGVEDIVVQGSGAVRVIAGAGGVVVTTGSGNDRFEGAGGSDVFDGGAGRDTFLGGAGNDVLIGGAGADRMDGGIGDDVYLVDDTGDLVIDASLEDSLDVVLASVDFRLGGLARIEVLSALNPDATDPLVLQGNGWGQEITGNAGGNLLRGNGGADWLQGLAGDDTLISGAGGADMEGGAGDDLYRVLDAADRVFEAAGEGYDRVISAVSYVLQDGSEVEELRLSGGATTRSLTGNGLAQSLHGDGGGNLLVGGGGGDTLVGHAGDDTLIGGGNAVLIGGAGADTFVFAPGGADRIRDFDASRDMIWIDIGLGASQALEALRVNLTGLAEAESDRVILDSRTGTLWYDADGTGDFTPLRLGQVQGAAGLDAAHILLI